MMTQWFIGAPALLEKEREKDMRMNGLIEGN